MKLPEFKPANWVVEVYRFPTHEKEMKRSSPDYFMTEYFVEKEDAEKFAAEQTREYQVISYKGEIREATPRDHAKQRLIQIAEAFAIELDNTFVKEQDILIYDTWEFGHVDYKTDILEAVRDVLEQYPPEEPFYDYKL